MVRFFITRTSGNKPRNDVPGSPFFAGLCRKSQPLLAHTRLRTWDRPKWWWSFEIGTYILKKWRLWGWNMTAILYDYSMPYMLYTIYFLEYPSWILLAVGRDLLGSSHVRGAMVVAFFRLDSTSKPPAPLRKMVLPGATPKTPKFRQMQGIWIIFWRNKIIWIPSQKQHNKYSYKQKNICQPKKGRNFQFQLHLRCNQPHLLGPRWLLPGLCCNVEI